MGKIEEANPAISLRLKTLAAAMRHFPRDIRRIQTLWTALYDWVGGGRFSEAPEIDSAWPPGLQKPVYCSSPRALLLLDLSDWSDRRTYFSGKYYQEHIGRVYESLLKAGDQYVDIGANIGMTVLMATVFIGPSGKVLAFEPNPSPFERLTRHLELNRAENVSVHQFGLGNIAEVKKLSLASSHTGKGTMVEQEIQDGAIDVDVRQGDEFLCKLDSDKSTFVKMDVEGYEMNVLGGLRDFETRREVAYLIEVTEHLLQKVGHSAQELHTHMEKAGFECFRPHLRATRWERTLEFEQLKAPLDEIQYDALFLKPNSKFYERANKFMRC